MNRFIEEKQEDLVRSCEKYRVSRLELFGSAASEDFDPAASDVDFLAEFHNLQTGQYADSYFGLLEELEGLFGRPVDLVMASAIRNPYFAEQIDKSKRLLYAA